MKHFAANYVFTGCDFIRNCCLSFSDDGRLVEIGEENSSLLERERMIFLNGILCPHFDAKSIENKKLTLKDLLSSLGLHFDKNTHLPIVLLKNVDLQTLNFTNETIAKEIY
ncbi:MAG: hypothetical protein IKK36_11095 [Bacteroidales bacterium]|nr:hypothetical protein [Bacteroidales bacterium]